MAKIVKSACYASVTDDQWTDWRWQQRSRITKMDELEKVIRVTDEERDAFAASDELFHMGITPYYASLMDPDDPDCPIRLQAVPKLGELLTLPTDLKDPLNEEGDMVAPGVTHRYPDRVLLYTNHNCAMYCRFCTRKRKVSDPTSAQAKAALEQGLAYITGNPAVRDVVISGGDPLSLSDERLAYILKRLHDAENVVMCRIGSRNLVTLPQRITPELCGVIREFQSHSLAIYFNTHFNHPREITDEAWEACDRVAETGTPIQNQMVLLKGVNDDVETVRELNRKLLRMRVKPYYIYQCDLSEGISHFRTPVSKGIEIMEGLRGHMSGLGVPTFVVDAPGGGGKIPVAPSYVVSHDGKTWTLRNFQQRTFTYHEA